MPTPPEQARVNQPLSPDAELQAKRERARRAIPAQAPYQPFFGLTVVSCEGGDVRQSPSGLWVETPGRAWEIRLPTDRSPREHVLDELAGALQGGRPALHDGRWGLATLELCLAAMSSARRAQAVRLRHQVPVPD
jgi:phthalate 4,5-cis-dihydrodiol dehydrogenase